MINIKDKLTNTVFYNVHLTNSEEQNVFCASHTENWEHEINNNKNVDLMYLYSSASSIVCRNYYGERITIFQPPLWLIIQIYDTQRMPVKKMLIDFIKTNMHILNTDEDRIWLMSAVLGNNAL